MMKHSKWSRLYQTKTAEIIQYSCDLGSQFIGLINEEIRANQSNQHIGCARCLLQTREDLRGNDIQQMGVTRCAIVDDELIAPFSNRELPARTKTPVDHLGHFENLGCMPSKLRGFQIRYYLRTIPIHVYRGREMSGVLPF